MKYENKELLLAKLEAINQLSLEATQMIKELFSEDEGLVEFPQVPTLITEEELAEVTEEDNPNKDDSVEEVEEEIEEEKTEDFSQELLTLDIYTKGELERLLKENFNVKVPKNSSKEKLEELIQNLVAEYGKDDILETLNENRHMINEMQVCAKCICGDGVCSECEELRGCYEKQCEALIDDDGEMHPMGEAYFAGDKLCCCGFYCEEEKGTYKCIVCGVEYELE